MSGDVQPRKRKDKKKRKDDGDQIPEKLHVPFLTNNNLNNEDVNIHVHKDEGTGGGICAKFVFFILFSALAVLIGLIITEYRGLTDLETIDPNSKFSQIFEGWVDSNSHGDLNEHVLDDDHEEGHDDLADEDDHDDHSDEDDHDDEEFVDAEHSEEQDEDDDDDDDEILEPIDDDDEDEEVEEEDIEEDDVNEIDDEEEDDEDIDSLEETKEVVASEEEEDTEQDEDDQNDNKNDEDDEQRDIDDSERKDFDDDVDDDQDIEQDYEDQEDEELENEEVSSENRNVSEEKLDDEDDIGNKGDEKDDKDFRDDQEDKPNEDIYSDKNSNEKDEDKDDVNGDNIDINDEEKIQLESKTKETVEQDEGKPEDVSLESSGSSKFIENRDSDSDKQSESNDYEYTNITNEDDYKIKNDIDEAQNSVKHDTSHAIVLFDKILQKFPSSPRSLYGKALALDILADKKRSNDILKKSLQIYVQLLQTNKVPSALYQLAAERCINRMRFIGQYKNAIAVHKLTINRFPNDPKHLNSLVVTYLTINRIEDARTVLKQILTKWPKDGFALVHYGFILKTSDNDLKNAVRYLKKGISTKEEGVIDGRFYFHLGDALVRLGTPEEAAEVYEEGSINKLFLSKNQRSLYNVPRLSAKPWWSFKDVPSYSKSLDLLTASWKQIRKEGLSILNEKGYFEDESENLKHTGEWKQFELYARGQKNIKNCKMCPITCSIIDQIPEARTCKRGQTKFSVMHPGTHIWPHCGPTNCRLRVHLGLKIPSKTFIRVADDVKSWKEGEVLIFDDSFEHEVWHNGTDFRLILIVDIWHPELTPTEINSLSPI